MGAPLRHVVTDVGFKAMGTAHRAALALSGGRLGSRAFGMPVVELHTIGRRTGRPRVTTLTAPIIEEGRFVLVASKGGDDRDPDWYCNLVAQPDALLVVAGEQRPVRARTATPEERAELWPRVTAAYHGYGGYQRRTERQIPLVICDPR